MTAEAGTGVRPQVSVVIATFNAAAVLEPCLEGLFDQVGVSLEVLVADGGSTDGSREMVERFGQRLAWYDSRPDEGIYDAWNRALGHARGEWVMFLGADDRLASSHAVASLHAHCGEALDRGIRIVYGVCVLVDGEGHEIKVLGRPWQREKRRFRAGVMRIPHPGMLHHQSLFSDHGLFDTRSRIAGDYEFLLRELRTRDALFVPGCRVASLMAGGSSDTAAGRFEGLQEVLEARRKWGLRGLPPRLMASLAKAGFQSLLAAGWRGR